MDAANEGWFPGRLLWIDGFAALSAGLLSLALLTPLSTLYGLPESLVRFVGLVNLAYAAYGLFVARAPRRSHRQVKCLAWANLAWMPVCLGIAATFAHTARPLGLAVLSFEAAFVTALGLLELRHVRDLVR